MAAVWNRLVEPAPRLQILELRQKARLLASVLAVLIVFTLVFILPAGLIFASEQDTVVHLVSISCTLIVLLLSYLLTKRGYPHGTGYLLMVYATTLILTMAVVRERDNMLMLFFLLIVMMFANLFFSARMGVTVFFIHLGLMVLLPFITPKLDLALVLQRPVIFYTISTMMFTTFGYVRDQLEAGSRQRLALSEGRFRAAIDGSFDAFFLLESVRDQNNEITDFRIIDANTRSEQQIGVDRDFYLGRTIRDMTPELLDYDLLLKFRNVVETGAVYDEELLLPLVALGRNGWFHFHVTRVDDGVAVFSRDITERKQAEDALRESEKRYRLIFETTSDYAFSMRVEPDGAYTLEWITDSFERATGYPITTDLQILSQVYHPDDYPLVIRHMQDLLAGKRVAADYRIVTKSGETRWFQFTRWPERDEQTQKIVRYLGVAHDITDRKKAEQTQHDRERLRIALQTERELSDLKNRLMMTISHEFRTPLATIQASSDIIRRYFERMSPEQRETHAETIQKQVRHLSEMMEDISFALQNVGADVRPKLERINLIDLCQSLVDEMRYTMSARHSLEVMSKLASLEVMADIKLVNRALRNLISNAVKYSPEGGAIVVEVTTTRGNAIVRVCDQGIGISPDDQAHVFQPFFRAGNSGFVDGTGIGLSIVKDCVALHGGSVSVESTLGKGSTFTVQLPLVPKDEPELMED